MLMPGSSGIRRPASPSQCSHQPEAGLRKRHHRQPAAPRSHRTTVRLQVCRHGRYSPLYPRASRSTDPSSDQAYNLSALSNSTNAPLAVTLRNKTFEVALFPSNIHFIPDSDPPTAEAKMLVFTHPGLAEGPYSKTASSSDNTSRAG